MARTWRTVVGLEVHVQLSTESKLFSRAAAIAKAAVPELRQAVDGSADTGAAARARGWALQSAAAPNVRVSLFDAAIPGTLPRLNYECVRRGVRLGLALAGDVHRRSHFERKHYFYADLPHGYQITQQEAPLVTGGRLRIRTRDRASTEQNKSEPKDVRIARVQLETDSGKSLHAATAGVANDANAETSLIDLNRAGVGLLEVVTHPDMSSAEEAAAFVKTLQNLVRHTSVSTANIDEGELRCDVNVSLEAADDPSVRGERCEIKNVNGARYVAKAIEFEVERQRRILESGGSVSYETRAFDASNSSTVPLRSKELDVDYRFMPEPDLPPIVLSEEFVESCRADLGELPEDLRARLVGSAAYGLSDAQADLLLETGLAQYFESVVAAAGSAPPSLCASTIVNQLLGLIHDSDLDTHVAAGSLPAAENLGALVSMRHGGELSSAGLRVLLRDLFESPRSLPPGTMREHAKERGLLQESGAAALETWCGQAVATLPAEVDAYRAGQDRVLRRLVGEVMKLSRGSANPAEATRILKEIIATGSDRGS